MIPKIRILISSLNSGDFCGSKGRAYVWYFMLASCIWTHLIIGNYNAPI